MSEGRIPIADAKRVATERRCPVVVIFGIHDNEDRFTVASYGMTRKLCKLGGAYADAIADAILSGKVRAPESEPPDSEAVAALKESNRRLQLACDVFEKNSRDAVEREARVRELEAALRTVSEESGCYCHEEPRFRPNDECGVCAARRLLAPPRTQGEGR